jgi:3-hydroxyisobutyrate dehydrogenase-like beta-hydroxyacid dehydrogenase
LPDRGAASGQSEIDLKAACIGLGNGGSKLAGTLLRNGVDLTLRDLDRAAAEPLLANGLATASLLSLCEALVTER